MGVARSTHRGNGMRLGERSARLFFCAMTRSILRQGLRCGQIYRRYMAHDDAGSKFIQSSASGYIEGKPQSPVNRGVICRQGRCPAIMQQHSPEK